MQLCSQMCSATRPAMPCWVAGSSHMNLRCSRSVSSQVPVMQQTPALRTGRMSRSHVSQAATADGGGGSSGTGGLGSSGSGGAGNSGQPHGMQTWTYLFAAALAAGGVMGYMKRGSSQSLTAGVSASVILALCARSMAGAGAANAARIAFALTLVLGMVMLSRYIQSRKVFPAGAVSGVSLLMAGGYLATGL